jgi:diadenylate cyclase
VTELLWYLQQLAWKDALDILLVAFIFFWILYMLRGTRAVPLVRGVVFLILVIIILSGVVRLRAFGWLAQSVLPALLLAIPVVFQPEIRRALERIGRAGSLVGYTTSNRASIERMLTTVTEACRILSERRNGALIVLELETGLQEFVDSGVFLDAAVTPELLVTVFDPNTMLHDGAVIIRRERAIAAACVLPLSTAFLADRQLGLRHRAAIGVTEESDAVAVVVSEERGSIAVAHNGRIIRNLGAKRLGAVLRAFFQPMLEGGWPRWLARVQRISGRD